MDTLSRIVSDSRQISIGEGIVLWPLIPTYACGALLEARMYAAKGPNAIYPAVSSIQVHSGLNILFCPPRYFLEKAGP